MQFDSQEQKNLVLMALNKLTVELGQAQAVLKVAAEISQGEVLTEVATVGPNGIDDKKEEPSG